MGRQAPAHARSNAADRPQPALPLWAETQRHSVPTAEPELLGHAVHPLNVSAESLLVRNGWLGTYFLGWGWG